MITTKALRAALGSAIAVAALAAVLTGCDGSGYAADESTGEGSSFSETGFGSDDTGFGSESGFDSEGFGSDSGSDSGSVIFGSDGDSLTTLPGGGISFSGSDGSSFSSE